jgi:peptide-methionine (S)-S-oxide reductase
VVSIWGREAERMRESVGKMTLGVLVLILTVPGLGCGDQSEEARASGARGGEVNTTMETKNENTEKAVFAAGCFWGVEASFRKLSGVVSTRVGYTGGKTKDPTYREVCGDRTGHAEAVEVVYDPDKVSYRELLDLFWSIHDPTQVNRQGPDVGSQYRSAIFYLGDDQARIAGESKEKLEKSGKHRRRVATEIVAATEFYPAEDYHQQYYEKHGISGCPTY